MVVTAHHAATTAAMGILAEGGNAVDASVAANAVLGVVAPETCGVGGDLFALIHRSGMERPAALNASGRAGSGVRPAAEPIDLTAAEAVTVPGCADGWGAMASGFGTQAMSDLLAPAITLAEDGFEVSAELAGALGRVQPLLRTSPAADALYPDGRPPVAGDTLRRPELAATLQALADGGRDAFFDHIGPALTDAVDGLITGDDLARPQADWIEPISTTIGGHVAWTVPPNSQGYVALAALGAAQRVGMEKRPADFHHTIIEAYKVAAAERDAVVADPESAPLDQQALLADEHLDFLASQVDRSRAQGYPRPPRAVGGTTFLCVIDADGLAVSLIQSNFTGFGGGRSVAGTGVFLHNRGAGFSHEAGHPNALAPGRRPLHTLSPTLWTRRGAPSILLGTRGGHQQPQYLAQMGGHLVFSGLDPETAQRQPRWSMDHAGVGTSPPVEFEATASPELVSALRARGHIVDTVPEDLREGWGPVAVITVGTERVGAADPRVSTASAASE